MRPLTRFCLPNMPKPSPTRALSRSIAVKSCNANGTWQEEKLNLKLSAHILPDAMPCDNAPVGDRARHVSYAKSHRKSQMFTKLTGLNWGFVSSSSSSHHCHYVVIVVSYFPISFSSKGLDSELPFIVCILILRWTWHSEEIHRTVLGINVKGTCISFSIFILCQSCGRSKKTSMQRKPRGKKRKRSRRGWRCSYLRPKLPSAVTKRSSGR